MNKKFNLVVLGLLLLLPFATALDFNQTISASDQAQFDQILSPFMKIYNFFRYGATLLAVIVLVYAGIIFISSGNDIAKREQTKMLIMYVVIGLIVIWIAPLIVKLVTG